MCNALHRQLWGRSRRPKVMKYAVTGANPVPDHISKPDYATSGVPTVHPPYALQQLTYLRKAHAIV